MNTKLSHSTGLLTPTVKSLASSGLIVISLLGSASAYADYTTRFSDLLKQRAKETVSEVVANQAARTTDRVLDRAVTRVLDGSEKSPDDSYQSHSGDVSEEIKVTYDETPVEVNELGVN
jgi:hypothetical protein